MAHRSPQDCMRNITQSLDFVKSMEGKRELPLNFLAWVLILKSQGRLGFDIPGVFEAYGNSFFPSIKCLKCLKNLKKTPGGGVLILVLNYTEINRDFKGGVFSKVLIDKGRQAQKMEHDKLKVVEIYVFE